MRSSNTNAFQFDMNAGWQGLSIDQILELHQMQCDPRNSLNAAATYYPHSIEYDQYQPEIADIVRRTSPLFDRMTKIPGNGRLSNFHEQTSMTEAYSVDIAALNLVDGTNPTRRDRAVRIKGIGQGFKTTILQQDLAKIGPNRDLETKDMIDTVRSMSVLANKMLWTGTDTSASINVVGDAVTLQYVAIPKQITTAVEVITSAMNITDQIRLQVAKAVADETVDRRFTAIWVNPLVQHLIEQEHKQDNNTIAQVEILPGVRVTAIQTAAGILPIISDPHFKSNPSWANAAPGGETNYPYLIVDESLFEFHYIGSPLPRQFVLPMSNALTQQTVWVHFGAPVVKLPDIAHIRGVIQRATL